jgi:hypothetical protein
MRFKYEAPGLLRKAAITIKAPRMRHANVRPWIFDSHSGIRLQLTEEEEAVIQRLAACMAKRVPGPSLDEAFDYVADAIVRRRLGYGFDWRSLANWTAADWDGWINAAEERLDTAA